MDSELMKALEILGFEQSSYAEKVPKLKFVTKKYHRLLQKNHPDKGGDEELCKKITEAYRLIGEHLEKQEVDNNEEDYDFEEEVAMKTFKQFKTNVKENLKSFTINIDNETSFTWEKILTQHYGPPLDRKTNGLHWKIKNYTDGNIVGDITIGKWHKPKKDNKSKLHVQSNEAGNFLPAHFVDHKLPKLFQEVSKSHSANKSQVKPKTPFRKLTKPRVSVAKTLKCDECEFTTKTPSHLAKHKKLSHIASPISNKTSDEEKEYPSLLSAFHCAMCGKGFSQETSLSLHERIVHEIKCTSCDCAFYTNDDLVVHINAKHTVDPSKSQQTSMSTPFIQQQKTCLSCEITDANTSQHDPHSNDTVELLKCEKCPFTTAEEVVLNHHVLMMHVPGFECHECKDIIWPEDPVSDCSACSLFYHKKCTKSEERHVSPSNWTCHNCCLTICNICQHKTTNEKSLEAHMLSNHRPDTGFQCDICLQGFEYEDNLKIHMMYCHPMTDQPIEHHPMTNQPTEHTQQTNEQELSTEHNPCECCKIVIKESDLKITCNKCVKTFHKKCTTLKKATGHWKPNYRECENCQNIPEHHNDKEKDTDIENAPLKPSAKHRKSNAVACNHPDKEFLMSQINTLKSVIAKREAELKQIQESDKLKAKKIMQLEAQLNEARTNGCIVNDDNKVTQENEKIKNLEMKTSILENQINLILNKLDNREPVDTLLFSCDQCDSEFSHKDELQKHRRERHVRSEDEAMKRQHYQQTLIQEQFYCAKCDYRLQTYNDLEEHLQTQHMKCNLCSYHAIHQNDLRRHKITMHNQVKPCDLCPYKPFSNSDLRRHKQTMHRTDEDFPSNNCDYVATSESDTHKHLGTHSKDNLFKCNFCNSAFKSKRELVEHINMNHKHMQRTRIFSSRTHPTQGSRPAQKSPNQDDLFRPWSPSNSHFQSSQNPNDN